MYVRNFTSMCNKESKTVIDTFKIKDITENGPRLTCVQLIKMFLWEKLPFCFEFSLLHEAFYTWNGEKPF